MRIGVGSDPLRFPAVCTRWTQKNTQPRMDWYPAPLDNFDGVSCSAHFHRCCQTASVRPGDLS
jgi:hypothetical protein